MGSRNVNRFKNGIECTEYLKSKGINTVTCIEYGGTFKSKSIFKCDIDGYEWESTLNAVRNTKAKGCPKCGNVARIKTIEEVNSWLRLHERTITCTYYDGTVGSSKSKFMCNIDGYEWNSEFSNIKTGRGCAVCSNLKKIKDIEEVNQWLLDNNKDFHCISYAGNLRELSIFECDICKKNWKATFNNIKNGNECPHCSASNGEKAIAKVLDNLNITYKTELWFADCRAENPLPFDFAIFLSNKIILLCEYQGKQHYEPVDFAGKGINWAKREFKKRKEYDNLKRQYCKINGIPLLEIPYWDFENIENIISNRLNKIFCGEAI